MSAASRSTCAAAPRCPGRPAGERSAPRCSASRRSDSACRRAAAIKRLGLGLGPLGVRPAVLLHPGADLFDLGQSARLEIVTLARGVLPRQVRFATSLLADPLGVDVRPIERLAGLLLGQPQDVGGAAAEIGVVDLRGGLPGLLELVGHGGQLLFELRRPAAGADQRALQAADVVVHGVPVVPRKADGKLPTALAASSNRPSPVLSAEVMLAPCCSGLSMLVPPVEPTSPPDRWSPELRIDRGGLDQFDQNTAGVLGMDEVDPGATRTRLG